jgi:hypothetical protein
MPPPSDPIASVRAKIERAKAHIPDFQVAQRKFGEANVDLIQPEDDAKAKRRRWVVKFDPIIPRDYAIIAGDILNNLQSALDHLAWRLCVLGVGTVPKERIHQVHFPVAGSSGDYPSRVKGTIEGLAKADAIEAIRLIEPYKGGKGELLWVLAKLNGTDKHRLLIGGALRDEGSEFGPQRLARILAQQPHLARELRPEPGTFKTLGTVPRGRVLKEGDVVLDEPFDLVVDEKASLVCTVALNEPGVIAPRTFIPLFEEMIDFVGNVVVPALETHAQ